MNITILRHQEYTKFKMKDSLFYPNPCMMNGDNL